MDKKLQTLYWVFVIFTLLPLLVIFPLSMLEYFGSNSAALSLICLVSILPLTVYYYQSRQALSSNGEFNTILRVTFYVNFLIYMFAILVAFYFLIIGGFLFTGQTPIGLDLEQSQAPCLPLRKKYQLSQPCLLQCFAYHQSKKEASGIIISIVYSKTP